jgi:hypothetical protein
LQKQKKKEEAKAAVQATTPPVAVAATPAPSEAQPVGNAIEQPVESIEEASKAAEVGNPQSAQEGLDASERHAESTAAPADEVGLCLSTTSRHHQCLQGRVQKAFWGGSSEALAIMNTIVAARASELRSCSSLSCTSADVCQDFAPLRDSENHHEEDGCESLNVTKDAKPNAADPSEAGQNGQVTTTDTPNAGMMGMNPMMMNSMSGQMGFGFPNQAGFNNGMGFMPNMMNGGNWNAMNSMGSFSPTVTKDFFTDLVDRFQQHERHVRQFWWEHGHGHERHVFHEFWRRIWWMEWNGWWLWQLQRVQPDGWI